MNTRRQANSLATLFYRDPRLTTLAIGLLVVAGLSSFAVLPRMEDPLLTPRAALVLTQLSGADAEQVEALVTDRIEEELREITEIKELRSESRAGMSTINVELRDDVYADTAASVWSKIRDRLADAEPRLPQNASKPRFEELEVTAYTRLIALVWDGALADDSASTVDKVETVDAVETVDFAKSTGAADAGTVAEYALTASHENSSATATSSGTSLLSGTSGSERHFTRVQQVEHWGVLSRLAEDLRDQLLAVPGTKDVDLLGNPQEEIIVEISADRLSSLGMTAAQLSRVIADSDSRISAGQIRNDLQNLQIEVSGELDSIARISVVPIKTVASGQTVRVGDVSTVRRGIVDPPDDIAIVDGKPAIVLACLIRPSQRVDQWSVASQSVTAAFADRLSGDVRLTEVFDQNVYVQDRLDSLLSNLLVGVASVVCVIWWLMGWRSAVIVATALPLSSFMVLAGMRWMQIPIHQMSVTGLIIALGLLIDNAIVLVDEIHHRRCDGLSALKAIEETIHSLATPLFGSTLTTALAFAPIALMPGPAGEFVSSISVNVILAIFSSLLLSLTIVPALTGFLSDGSHGELNRQTQSGSEKPAIPQRTSRWYRDGWSNKRVTLAYDRFLAFILRHPWIGIAVGLTIPLAGFFQARLLPEQFFPPADRNQISIELELPAQASINATLAIAQRVRQQLLQDDAVKQVSWFVGRSAPPFYYNQIPSTRGMSRYAQALVELKSGDEVAELIKPLQRQLDRRFPEVRTLVRQLEQGPPFLAPIEVRVKGPDLAELAQLASRLRSILVQVPQVTHVRTESSELLPALTIQVDEDEARLAGLSHQSISSQVAATLEGAVGGLVLEGTEELPLRVRVADAGRDEISDLQSLNVLSELASMNSFSGDEMNRLPGIPLTVFGQPALRQEVASVTRLNRRRINEVQGFVEAGVLPATILSQFRRQLEQADLKLPAGYEIEFGGEAAERDDAVNNLMASVGVLAVMMVATLVLSFGSFRLAGIIGVVGVLSVGLGLGSLWLWGWPFGFMAIIGTMGLVGVAINDSIVVLAAINDDPDAATGDKIAVQRVVMRCTRHVVATSLTTIAGFLPLWLGGGQFWPPLAVTIAGGVGGATALAIFFVPSVFVWQRAVSRNSRQMDTNRFA